MANRARLTVDDAKAALSALDRLVGGEDVSSIPIEEVPLDRVRPNPTQPRDRESNAFSEESLQELATSIAAYGVLQPIIVRRDGRFYHIIAGERRYRACLLLKLNTIPARVIEPATDEEELEISLVENLQRRDLDPLEEAQIFRRMLDELDYTYRSLSERIGKSVGFIDSRMKLIAYDDVRDAVQRREIGVVEARELAKVENPRIRGELLERISAGELNRDHLKEAIKDATRETRPVSKRAKGDAAVKSPENELGGALRRCLSAIDKYEDYDEFASNYPELAKLVEMLVSRVSELRGDSDGRGESPDTAQPGARPLRRLAPLQARTDAGETELMSAPPDGEEQHIIDHVKGHRSQGNLSILDSISRYWMVLERRGYQFQMGDWSAERSGPLEWLVKLNLSIDGEEYVAEWSYDERTSDVHSMNDHARTLTQRI